MSMPEAQRECLDNLGHIVTQPMKRSRADSLGEQRLDF